jgi:hypothetical protein
MKAACFIRNDEESRFIQTVETVYGSDEPDGIERKKNFLPNRWILHHFPYIRSYCEIHVSFGNFVQVPPRRIAGTVLVIHFRF